MSKQISVCPWCTPTLPCPDCNCYGPVQGHLTLEVSTLLAKQKESKDLSTCGGSSKFAEFRRSAAKKTHSLATALLAMLDHEPKETKRSYNSDPDHEFYLWRVLP